MHEFLELGQPERITPLRIDDPNDVLFALSTHLRRSFPVRVRHPALELTWRDGADHHPDVPERFHDRQPDGSTKAPKLGGAGTVLFRADGDFAVTRGSPSGGSSVIPGARVEEFRGALDAQAPPLSHEASFTAACMGEGSTRAPFGVGGALIAEGSRGARREVRGISARAGCPMGRRRPGQSRRSRDRGERRFQVRNARQAG